MGRNAWVTSCILLALLVGTSYTSQLTTEEVQNCGTEVDVVFVVDMAGQWLRALDATKNFLDTIATSLTKGRMGIITYNSRVDWVTHLACVADFRNATMEWAPSGGEEAGPEGGMPYRDLGQALQAAEMELSTNNRHGVRNYVLVMGDGQSSDMVTHEASHFKTDSVQRLGILLLTSGLAEGSGMMKQWATFATDSRALFSAGDPDQALSTAVDPISNDICAFANHIVNGPAGPPIKPYETCDSRCVANAVFVADGSPSVRKKDFQKERAFLHKFFLSLGPLVRGATILFGRHSKWVSHMAEGRAVVANQILNMQQGKLGKGTKMLGPLKKVQTEVQSTAGSIRTTVFIISDGLFHDYPEHFAADMKRNLGVEVMCIGVGKDVDREELQALGETVMIDSYDDLDSVSDTLCRYLCPTPKPKLRLAPIIPFEYTPCRFSVNMVVLIEATEDVPNSQFFQLLHHYEQMKEFAAEMIEGTNKDSVFGIMSFTTNSEKWILDMSKHPVNSRKSQQAKIKSVKMAMDMDSKDGNPRDASKLMLDVKTSIITHREDVRNQNVVVLLTNRNSMSSVAAQPGWEPWDEHTKLYTISFGPLAPYENPKQKYLNVPDYNRMSVVKALKEATNDLCIPKASIGKIHPIQAVDITICWDITRPIGRSVFKDAQTFIIDLVEMLGCDENVGVCVYGEDRVEWLVGLTDMKREPYHYPRVQAMVNQIQYTTEFGKDSNATAAFEEMYKEHATHGRPYAAKKVVLMGEAQGTPDPAMIVREIREANMDIVTVGIGEYDQTRLKEWGYFVDVNGTDHERLSMILPPLSGMLCDRPLNCTMHKKFKEKCNGRTDMIVLIDNRLPSVHEYRQEYHTLRNIAAGVIGGVGTDFSMGLIAYSGDVQWISHLSSNTTDKRNEVQQNLIHLKGSVCDCKKSHLAKALGEAFDELKDNGRPQSDKRILIFSGSQEIEEDAVLKVQELIGENGGGIRVTSVGLDTANHKVTAGYYKLHDIASPGEAVPIPTDRKTPLKGAMDTLTRVCRVYGDEGSAYGH